jgi:hypothetical protein
MQISHAERPSPRRSDNAKAGWVASGQENLVTVSRGFKALDLLVLLHQGVHPDVSGAKEHT